MMVSGWVSGLVGQWPVSSNPIQAEHTHTQMCNNQPNDNTLKANPDDNTLNLKANPALCKYSTTTTIKTTAQIMHW